MSHIIIEYTHIQKKNTKHRKIKIRKRKCCDHHDDDDDVVN